MIFQSQQKYFYEMLIFGYHLMLYDYTSFIITIIFQNQFAT
jgi:hypothetical protein